MAPSACNKQPWKWLVVKSDEAKEKLQECYDREWFKTAPMYIVGMRNKQENWVRKEDNKPHGDIDVAIATEHLCLSAAERGLGTCWVCNYDPHDILKLSNRQSEVFFGDTFEKDEKSQREAGDIFPEYYLLCVNNFDKVAKTHLDEWIRFLKTGEIEDSDTAPGLADAKECLDVRKLSREELLGLQLRPSEDA